MKERSPEAEEMRMISSQNSRQMNSLSGYSRSRIYHRTGTDDSHKPEGHFSIRLFFAVLLFAGFCFMAEDDRTIGIYDSAKIKEVIQQDMDIASYIDAFRSSQYLRK